MKHNDGEKTGMTPVHQVDKRRNLAAVGLIVLLVLTLLWPVTFGGKLLLPADMLMVMQPWRAHASEVGFRRVHTPFLDSIQQHYAWRKFAAEQMRQGITPLWNPYMFCGAPFVANNQSACFYPETWLFMLMPPEKAFGWAAFLSLSMGGTFMFFFLRLLGLRRSAAVVGTIPFVFCGFLVGWMLLPTVRAVPMWLPLMLLAFEKALRASGQGARLCNDDTQGSAKRLANTRQRSALFWAAVCALAVGMQFLAGHLHVSLFVLMIFGAYVVFRLLQEWRSGEHRAAWLGLVAATAALLTGTMLAALQLLPVLELAGMTSRKGGIAFSGATGAAMQPFNLLTALIPDLFGNPVDGNFWGLILSPTNREYIETVWYIGMAPWLLVVAAFAWRKRRNAQTWFWGGVWLGGAGMAWGTVVYWIMFQLIPPLRQLPGVSRAVFICCFAGAVLAGMGFETICRKLEEQSHGQVRRVIDRAGIVLALIAFVAGVGTWLYSGRVENDLPGIGVYTLEQLLRCLVMTAAAAAALAVMTWTVKPSGKGEAYVSRRRMQWGTGLLIAVLAVDLLYFAGHFLPAVPDKYLHVRTRALEIMQDDRSLYRMTSLIGNGGGIDRMPPNLTMAFGFQDVEGSDSLVFEGSSNLLNAIRRDEKGNPDANSPLLDLLNCKYLLTSLDLRNVPGWVPITDYETYVYENKQVFPRAFVAGAVEQIRPEQALEKMRGEFDPTKVTYLSGLASTLPAMAPQPIEVSVPTYQSNLVTVNAKLPASRLLVLGDTWYPGWRAYADGHETPVLRVNYALRGVVPPENAKQVTFVYYPASFAVGAFVSCVAVMLLCCGLVMGRRRTA